MLELGNHCLKFFCSTSTSGARSPVSLAVVGIRVISQVCPFNVPSWTLGLTQSKSNAFLYCLQLQRRGLKALLALKIVYANKKFETKLHQGIDDKTQLNCNCLPHLLIAFMG
jgi:hypothetical protein